METYLAYPDLVHSAEVLDPSTLVLQGVSVVELLNILHEIKPGILNMGDHPEIVKWRGHEPYLAEFGFALAARMEIDVYNVESAVTYHMECATAGEYTLAPPDWFGNTDYHVADQSALLRLNYAHYSNHFEGVRLDVPPFWTRVRG